MATEPRPLLSADLLQQVEETARDQNRNPEEVVSEAVRKYLDEQGWIKFVERNEAHARARGIAEEDVDRLICEVRSENRQSGRQWSALPPIPTSWFQALTSGAESHSNCWNWRAPPR